MRVLPKLENVEVAAVKIAEVLSVLKAGGQIDDAAALQMGETLDNVADMILPPIDAAPAGNRTVKQILDGVQRSLKNLSVEAQAADYALSDKADAILTDIETASTMISESAPIIEPTEPTEPAATEPTEPTEPVVATAAAVAPATEPTEPTEPVVAAPEPPVTAAPAEPTEPAVEPTEPVATEPVVAAAPEPAAEPVVAAAPEPIEPVVPATVEPTTEPTPQYATKSDLTQLSSTFADMLQEALKPVLELKAQLPVQPQAPQVPYVAPVAPAAPKRDNYSEQFDMACSPELDNLDEYGHFKS